MNLARLVVFNSVPRDAAKAYVKHVNRLLGSNRSPASLLFDDSPVELVVLIDAALAHSSVCALHVPKSISLLAIARPGVRKALDVDPRTKVEQADALTLRGSPHNLAEVAFRKPTSKKPALASAKQAGELHAKLRGDRMALLAAAEDLQRRLLPVARRIASANRQRSREQRAASRIQAVLRGRSLRRQQSDSGVLVEHRVRVAQARLLDQAGRMLARVVGSKLRLSSLQAPVYKQSRRPKDPPEPRLGLPRDLQAVLRYAPDATLARSYAATVNRILSAAPEAKQRQLPLSTLAILTSGPIELTAAVDSNLSSMTVSELKLPKGVGVVRYSVNGKRTLAIRPGLALDATKLLVGDDLTLRGLPHALPSVAEVKGGRVLLSKPKSRARSTHVSSSDSLKRDHEKLLESAERLAIKLQKLARMQLAQRSNQRRAHAALVIQTAWVRNRASIGSDVSFTKAKNAPANRPRARSPPLKLPTESQLALFGDAEASLTSATASTISTPASSFGTRSAAHGPPTPTCHRAGWAAARRKKLAIQAAGALQEEGQKYRQKRRPGKGSRATSGSAMGATAGMAPVAVAPRVEVAPRTRAAAPPRVQRTASQVRA